MWRFKRDFTQNQRVYDNSARTGHSQYWGLKHSSGVLYVTEILESTSVDGIIYFQASIDDGETWYECAKFVCKSSLVGSFEGFFERTVDKTIWLGTNGKNLIPAANRNSYQLKMTQLFSPVAALSGG